MRVERMCAHCDVAMLIFPYQALNDRKRFCSIACKSAAESLRRKGIGMRPFEERFWEKVSKEPGYGPNGDCWKWCASTCSDGYGFIGRDRRIVRAHRAAWEIANGDTFPVGFEACHTCDMPGCVRPDHIFVGTKSENQLDSVAKGRHRQAAKTHCPQGHEYTLENTYRDRRGRQCQTCRAARDMRKKQHGDIVRRPVASVGASMMLHDAQGRFVGRAG